MAKQCEKADQEFVQIFRSHRKFNRFVLAAFEDGFSVDYITFEKRLFRPYITVRLIKTHATCDDGHLCNCGHRCE